MKKTLILVLALALLLFALPSLAEESNTVSFTWRDYTLEAEPLSTEPKFIPDGIPDDMYPVLLVIYLEEGMMHKIDVQKELVPEATLIDLNSPEGDPYRCALPLLWQSNVGPDHLDLVYVVPKTLSPDDLRLSLLPADVPAEFVGTWHGRGEPASACQMVELAEDGTGSYVFEQNGYREEGEFNLSFTDNTFSLVNPNAGYMNSAEGTYTLENGVLTLDITSTLQGGRTYSYSVAMTKAE